MISSMPLEKRTPQTEMNTLRLLEEYERIRSQGYAEEWETFNPGEVSFSVPIFGKNKRVWCCLSLAAPREHVTDEKVISWLRHLNSGAEDISYKLQFRR
jgi:DNA-binding IclR family transcriptional regulator